jgi:STE24 endopeptidase
MFNAFSFTFITVFGLTLCLRLWLSLRHMSHINAHRDTVPREFSWRLSLSAHQKAADYTIAKARLGLIALAIEALVLLCFTFGGGLQVLHNFWSAQQFNELIYGIALIFSVMVISGLIDLPLSMYAQFVTEEKFGFNRMTLKLFFVDLVKTTILALVIGTPVLFVVLWLMAKMGSFWWLYVWIFWCAFNLLILFIYPALIAPLFNTFKPLDDSVLKERTEALLQRCGFAVSGFFVMDGSKRSQHSNAYFTGFGKTKRIVFFDTLLNRLQAPEIEAVLAHELGHFKRHHIVKRIAMLFTLSLVFLALLGQLMEADWFYNGLGVQAHNTVLALILFFLIMPVFTFLLMPLMSALSRYHEYEADQYAATHASSEELINALVKLYEDNASTLTPDPWYSLFYDSHPPAALRIARLS